LYLGMFKLPQGERKTPETTFPGLLRLHYHNFGFAGIFPRFQRNVNQYWRTDKTLELSFRDLPMRNALPANVS
jgi:hypothetical protein